MFIKKNILTSTVKEVVERNTGTKAEDFLRPMDEPYIKNLKEAVAILKQNVGRPIHIVGDYDSDGINATLIMYLGVKKCGFDVTTRLPHRFSEGYGLSPKIIDEIDSGVVITVDNGIAAFDAIKKAKAKGLTVIITDHHLAPVDKKTGGKVLPDADIIVDPAVEDESEFHHYCGAAIAYRFVKELLPNVNLIDLMVMASIATVSDVMPLHGANRTLVLQGLKAINAGRGVPGLRALIKELNLGNHITEGDYGFTLGPIINASGRLYDNGAEKVLNTFKYRSDNPMLPPSIMLLTQANERRKKILNESLSKADQMLDGDRPIVVYDPDFGEGIIGLIAGRYCEEQECPVIAFTKTEKGFLKGSGRSIPGIDLKKVLDSIQDTMIGYGGHAGAAGLSIKPENLEVFKKAFKEACGPIPEKSTDFFYDLEVEKREIGNFLKEQAVYAPYGEGNPQISVLLRNVAVKSYRRIGDGSHFLIYGDGVTLMGFGLAKKYEEAKFPNQITCVGYLKEHWFNGQCSFQMEVKDFEVS